MSPHDVLRFRVSRASLRFGDDKKPCDEAERGQIVVWERRTFKTPEEHDEHQGVSWLSEGSQHGIWHNSDGSLGGIKRRLPDREDWVVEFDSAEDLLAFVAKYDSVIISTEGDGTPSLTIYDDYVE